jgi:hypothetical protein
MHKSIAKLEHDFVDDLEDLVTTAAEDPGAWGRTSPNLEPRSSNQFVGDSLLAQRTGFRPAKILQRTIPYQLDTPSL